MLVINDGTPDLKRNSILLLDPAEKAKLRWIRQPRAVSLTQQASMSQLLLGKLEVMVVQ